jgi:hypothetical protein
VSRRLTVVQWTTGKTGRAAVRGLVGHPVLDLVGCYGTITTAMPAVNAIPEVCAAPPGIVNQMQLPLVRAAHQSRT